MANTFNANHTLGFNIVPDASSGRTLVIGAGHVLRNGTWVPYPPSTLGLNSAATTFIELDDTLILSQNLTGFTDGRNFLYKVVTLGGLVTSVQDWRNAEMSSPVPEFTTVKLTAIPTDATGLTTGQIWADTGALKII